MVIDLYTFGQSIGHLHLFHYTRTYYFHWLLTKDSGGLLQLTLNIIRIYRQQTISLFLPVMFFLSRKFYCFLFHPAHRQILCSNRCPCQRNLIWARITFTMRICEHLPFRRIVEIKLSYWRFRQMQILNGKSQLKAPHSLYLEFHCRWNQSNRTESWQYLSNVWCTSIFRAQASNGAHERNFHAEHHIRLVQNRFYCIMMLISSGHV